MSAGGGGGGERTEKATPERLRKARQDGSIARSQDVTTWVVVACGAVLLPSVLAQVSAQIDALIANIPIIVANPDPAVARVMFADAVAGILPALQLLLGGVVLGAVVASLAQGGLHLKKMKPRFEQFNLVTGLKRTFGLQALWNGAKALLKTIVIGAVLYSTVLGMMPYVQASGRLSLPGLLSEVSGRLASLLVLGIGAGLALSALDVVVTARRNRKHTRMTKQEVKDEAKKSEGDPHVKSQRRSIQMAMSRNRMMAAIPDADVVVVNPTHVAVALTYEAGKGAPRVVAKGKGAIAQKIRTLASEHDVPIVQDVMLARSLERTVKLGAEIPTDLFESVARVLAFVMTLRRRGASRGLHKVPGSAPVPQEE